MEEVSLELKGWRIDWLLRHKRLLSTIFTLIITFLGLLFYYFQREKREAFNQYMEAAMSYRTWEKSHFKDHTSLEKLLLLMDQRPDIAASCEGKIAQIEGGERLAFFQQKVLERSRELWDRFPYHLEYAMVSQLIETKKESDALISAIELKQKLRTASQEGSRLYAFNLLRIAVLEKRVGSMENEVIALRELKELEAYSILSDHFFRQGLSLEDYILSRI